MSTRIELLNEWFSEEGNPILAIEGLLNFLGTNLFHDYEPTKLTSPEFSDRLWTWIGNVDNSAERLILFKLASKIMYLGREEFNSLYMSAFEIAIRNFLIDQRMLTFFQDDFDAQLENAVNSTWFCPVTDSFRINQFYHLNQISASHEFRPDWRSLKKFHNPESVHKYIREHNISYVVLLEDFVGTGSQAGKPIKWAAEEFPDVQFLFVPIVICPQGLKLIQGIADTHANLKCSPVLILSQDSFIPEISPAEESHEDSLIRALAQKSAPYVDERAPKKQNKFGYGGLGALFVMYSNTPNNSLPLIHYYDDRTWKSLFLRHNRSEV
jgi:hypothetical protein